MIRYYDKHQFAEYLEVATRTVDKLRAAARFPVNDARIWNVQGYKALWSEKLVKAFAATYRKKIHKDKFIELAKVMTRAEIAVELGVERRRVTTFANYHGIDARH